jgi:membrane fusion protein
LLVPTRAIGFIKPGNIVELRYEAFAFQRFGQYRGTVDGVSRTVWSQGEKVGPMMVKEPVYRVDVKLDQQSVTGSGQQFPLKSGMLVSADILLEKRTIFEWMFEPVLDMKRRMQ